MALVGSSHAGAAVAGGADAQAATLLDWLTA